MKQFSWTKREEIMCLLIYKELSEKKFQWGLRTKRCRKMSRKKNTPSYNSICLKVANYENLFTNGKKGMWGGAQNPLTKMIYEKFKGCTIKELEYLIEKCTEEEKEKEEEP